MNAPIIYSHYGNSEYLYYSLKIARHTNPNKRLVLLGDDLNQNIAIECGWEYYNFQNYFSNELSSFRNVFRPISGRGHNNSKNSSNWLSFVFERWFLIYEFVRKNKIDFFWHFDSDTLIIDKLDEYETKLSEFDCSEQCLGNCINGFISTQTLYLYIKEIINLFNDANEIKLNNIEFSFYNNHFALTEMRAYNYFKRNNLIKTTCLNIFKFKYFDNALAFDEGFECFKLPNNRSIKIVLVSKSKFYFIKNGQYYRCITLNLSWMPIYIYKWVYSNIFSSEIQMSIFLKRERSISEIIIDFLKRIKGVIQ